MFPQGPRPTARPRITRYMISVANPRPARTPAARPSGVGAIPSGAPGASALTAADRAEANDPVTAPAHAGCRTEDPPSDRAIERRPFARSTAWPTWAANANAIAIVPIGKRNVATMFISASALARLEVVAGQATAAPPGGGPSWATIIARRSTLSLSPQLPQVETLASRTTSHFGHRRRSRVLSTSQRS